MSWAQLKEKHHVEMALHFWGIQKSAIEDVWEEVEPILEKAMLDTDFQRTSYLYDAILDDEKQLWIGDDEESRVRVVAITEIVRDPISGVSKLIINYCACDDDWEGRVNDWAVQLDHYLCAFGRANGCSKSEIWGRAGWLRILPDYSKGMVVMQKEL